jgi:hypothetical protein
MVFAEPLRSLRGSPYEIVKYDAASTARATCRAALLRRKDGPCAVAKSSLCFSKALASGSASAVRAKDEADPAIVGGPHDGRPDGRSLDSPGS